MHKEPQLIHCRVELLYFPQEIPEERLRGFFGNISQSTGIKYKEFKILPNNEAIFRTVEGNNISLTFIRKDRLIIQDDFPQFPLDILKSNVESIVKSAYNFIRVPFFISQVSVIRRLYRLAKFNDARVFLGDNMCGMKDKLFPIFNRPAHIFGLRLSFPPFKENKIGYNLRIESYARDPQFIFVENMGVYNAPLTVNNINLILNNLDETNRFIEENTLEFVEQFDVSD